MSLMITDDCIGCGACIDECPHEAIYEGEPYSIDPDKCSECYGNYPEPACLPVCPVDCILLDPDNIETSDELMLKSQYYLREN